MLEYNGELHTAAEWERIMGLPEDRILSRLNSGNYTISEAITSKLNKVGEYDKKEHIERVKRIKGVYK